MHFLFINPFFFPFPAKQRALLIEWLNSIFPNLNFPIKASDEELRACLIDGTVLCQILKRLKPASVDEVGNISSVCRLPY